MSPLMMQYFLLGIGLWVCLVLMIVGFLVAQNTFAQRVVLSTMQEYLRKQDKQLDYICRLNGTMVKQLRQTHEVTTELKFRMARAYPAKSAIVPFVAQQ